MNQPNYPSLAHHPQVVALLGILLEPAIVAGMPEQKAKKIYNDLMERYAQFTVPGAYANLERAIHAALEATDSDFGRN